jgi:hypothetical protein
VASRVCRRRPADNKRAPGGSEEDEEEGGARVARDAPVAEADAWRAPEPGTRGAASSTSPAAHLSTCVAYLTSDCVNHAQGGRPVLARSRAWINLALSFRFDLELSVIDTVISTRYCGCSLLELVHS